MRVTRTDDPAAVISAAGDYLRTRPVEHNLILSLLRARIERPEPGRYAWASSGEDVCGVFLQSPVTFVATCTQMPRAAVDALVDALDDVNMPGINGDAATTAMFAGAWAERRHVHATPAEGLRLYSLTTFVAAPPVPGTLRPFGDTDWQTVVEWSGAFVAETGSPTPAGEDADETARHLVGSRRLWLWESGGAPVCMVGAVPSVERVARIGPVYTPPDHRRRGYAAACTGAVTKILVDEGTQPALYTQLSNPTSNSVYRRLGYEPVSENVRYAFG